MIVGTIMTFLYIFTPMKKPFTLIFGVSAFNVWISVGLALAATAISTIAANKARAYSGLIDNATAVGPESDAGKP
jgi:hypothetical protein